MRIEDEHSCEHEMSTEATKCRNITPVTHRGLFQDTDLYCQCIAGKRVLIASHTFDQTTVSTAVTVVKICIKTSFSAIFLSSLREKKLAKLSDCSKLL